MRQTVIDRPGSLEDLQSQRKELAQRLQGLETEANTLRALAFEARVDDQLDDVNPATPATPSRVATIDEAITRNDTTSRAVRAAIERLDLAIADTKATIKAEARIARRAEARGMLAKIVPLIEELTALSGPYNELRKSGGDELTELPVAPSLFHANPAEWLRAARRAANG